MLFNSIEFAIFLPLVFLIYWSLNNYLKIQNLFVLIASYIFYGWWSWKFLLLLIFTSVFDFFIGLGIGKVQTQKSKKNLLIASIVLNLAVLGFFKYYNFFVTSFADAFTLFGKNLNIITLNIVLPVGISFYTFQSMSYTIDVYRGELKATNDIISFLAYISFFPQLVAGPIERATNLLPQFQKKREFNYEQANDGMRQILWGLFKKSVLADNIAIPVNDIYANYPNYSGSTLLLGVILFTFQVYCDFSGYSDIAVGSAKLFNFTLMRNFDYPFFSRDIPEFWKKWHISLYTWVRDYVYIPLGGNIKGKALQNIFILFLLIGLWHGANLTFVFWGLLQSIYYLLFLFRKNKTDYKEIVAYGKLIPNIKELFQMSAIFLISALSAVFFRAPTIVDSYYYSKILFSISLFNFPEIFPKQVLLFILILLVMEWFNRNKEHPLYSEKNSIRNKIKCCFIFLMIFFFASFNKNNFIYFQF
jgi:alginate O-acetyltransferase complex protein AlgI